MPYYQIIAGLIIGSLLMPANVFGQNIDTPYTSDSVPSPDEVRANQEPISYWFRRLASSDPAIRDDAKQAMKCHRDASNLPHPQALNGFSGTERMAKNSQLRRELFPLINLLIDLLNDPDEEIRELAMGALSCLGTSAAAARPVLLQNIKSGKYSRNESLFSAVTTVCYVSPRGIPVTNDLWCALSQSPFEPVSEEKVSPEKQSERDAFSANISATMLTWILNETNRTMIEIPMMAQVARTTSIPRVIRLLMLQTFYNLNHEARAANPILLELLNDKDVLIQMFAAGALIAQEDDRQAAELMVKSLRIDPLSKAKMQSGLQEEFESRLSTREFLREQLQNCQEFKRWIDITSLQAYPSAQRQWFRHLAQLRTDARCAVPELLTALRTGDDQTRLVALEALKQIAPDAIPISAPAACPGLSAQPSGCWRSVRVRSNGNQGCVRHPRRCRRR